MKSKKKGLAAAKRGKIAEVPQDVLDKNITKPTEAEIDTILNSLYDPVVWEKDPTAYAQAVAAYKASKGRGAESMR
jgi:hypothetical protein